MKSLGAPEGRINQGLLPSQSIYGLRQDVWHGYAHPFHDVVGPALTQPQLNAIDGAA